MNPDETDGAGGGLEDIGGVTAGGVPGTEGVWEFGGVWQSLEVEFRLKCCHEQGYGLLEA